MFLLCTVAFQTLIVYLYIEIHFDNCTCIYDYILQSGNVLANIQGDKS